MLGDLLAGIRGTGEELARRGEGEPQRGEERAECEAPEHGAGEPDATAGEQQHGGVSDVSRPEPEPHRVEGDQQAEWRGAERHESQRRDERSSTDGPFGIGQREPEVQSGNEQQRGEGVERPHDGGQSAEQQDQREAGGVGVGARGETEAAHQRGPGEQRHGEHERDGEDGLQRGARERRGGGGDGWIGSGEYAEPPEQHREQGAGEERQPAGGDPGERTNERSLDRMERLAGDAFRRVGIVRLLPQHFPQLRDATLFVAGGNITTVAAVPFGTGSILDNGTLNIVRTDSGTSSLVLSNTISGTGALVNSGAGLITVTSVNTYSGGTTASAGTFDITGTQALGTGTVTISGATVQMLSATALSTDAVNITSGTLDLNGNSVTLPGQLTGTGGTITDLNANGNDVLTLNSNNSGTFGGVFANAGTSTLSVVQNGTGTLVLTGANSQNGPITINAGTVQLGANSATGTIGSGGPLNNIIDNSVFAYDRSDTNGSETFNILQGSGANGSFVKLAAGTLTLTGTNTYKGTTTVSAGALVIGSTSAYPSGGVLVDNGAFKTLAGTKASPIVVGKVSGTGALTVGVTGTTSFVQLAFSSGADTQSTLNVGTGSTLDVNNNRIVLNYGAIGSDPVSAIHTALTSGYNAGAWTGTGITSSAAALNPSKFAVGYIDGDSANDANAVTGGFVTANQVKIAYTLAGDAFLEGTVGFDDLVAVAQNFGFTGKDWASGNFNYDPNGSVGFADLVNVAQNFGFTSGVSQGVGLEGGLSPAWLSGSGSASVSSITTAATSVVPEPTSIALVAAGAAGLLARRRRRA